MKKLCVVVLLSTILVMSAGCQRSSRSSNFNYSQNLAKEEALAKRALTHFAVACHLYAQENDGMLPDTMGALRPHVTEPYDLHGYALVASGKVRDIDDSSREILLRKKVPLPDGKQAIAYADGRVCTMRMSFTSTEDGSPPIMTSTEYGSPPKTTSTEDRQAPSAAKKPKWHFSLKKLR